MGKLNFRGYLILWFYPTNEIHKNFTHTKNMRFTVIWEWIQQLTETGGKKN